MLNSMSLNFKAKLENIQFSRNACAIFIHDLKVSLSFVQEIKTIISEGVTNSIIHGYNSDETKIVNINMSYDKEYIYLEIIDQGVGIPDINEARLPLFTTKSESERSGLGFTIMEVFSDSLIVESILNKGTKLIIKKKIEKDE